MDADQLTRNYRIREPDAGQQRSRAEVSARYGDWLAGRAAARGVPVVSARPWSTLLDRLRTLLVR
jgi:hypothetical protein